MLYKIGLLSILIHVSTCSLVVDTYTQQALNLSDYCPRIAECGDGSHVMCLYNTGRLMGPACYDFLTNTSITPDYAHFILSITNRIRSKIANGQVKAANGNPFPRGYGMFRVEWDEELATFAQVWANQCTLHQDMCRSSKKFPYVGQALGMIRLSLDDWMPIHNNEFNETYLTPAKVTYALKQVMRAWWEMKNEVSPNDIQMFNTSETVMHNNNFLNLIYGPLTHIGCGISVYKEYAYKDNMADLFFNCIQIVCNFSKRPKFGEPIFTVVPPNKPGYTARCGCPLGYDEDDDCLCYKTGRKIPYSCKDTDQCKPPVVILPIFTVEDAPSSKIRNHSSALRETSYDVFKGFNTLNNRIHYNNDIFTNLAVDDDKSDLTRRFPTDVKSRYFNKQPIKELKHNTTRVPYRLDGNTYTRKHFSRQSPSIFSRPARFELPVIKRKQVTVNLVQKTKEFKKDVAPRKDFTKVQKLVTNYLDKKRHRKPFDVDFESDGYISQGLVTLSDFNSTINQKLKENESYISKINPKLTYTNNLNMTKDQDKYSNRNAPVESDTKLMSLLDKLEEEVKNIEMNAHEKGMFDSKIRKIYGTLVGKSDLVDQKFKVLSKDSINETITANINSYKLSEIDQMNFDKHDFNLNKVKNNYNDFENFGNQLNKAYGKNLFNSEAKQFRNSDLKGILGGGNDNEERNFRNIHDYRENYNNRENRHHRLRTGDDYYPFSNERRRYYHQKLANLQKKVKNVKSFQKRVPEGRHIRPVRPTKQESQQRRRRPNDHVNSYYMPDRARFLHGF